jgi:hypothetical protein
MTVATTCTGRSCLSPRIGQLQLLQYIKRIHAWQTGPFLQLARALIKGRPPPPHQQSDSHLIRVQMLNDSTSLFILIFGYFTSCEAVKEFPQRNVHCIIAHRQNKGRTYTEYRKYDICPYTCRYSLNKFNVAVNSLQKETYSSKLYRHFNKTRCTAREQKIFPILFSLCLHIFTNFAR